MLRPSAETLVLERTELSTVDNANSCEDCPDVNFDPPTNSDCPYFDVVHGTPICTKEGNTQKQLESWFRTDIGNTACLNLVRAVETNKQLPGVHH